MSMHRLGRRILHAGLVVEAAGLLALGVVLHQAGASVTTLDLLAPMIVGGVGMGMVFVPLFDIVMAGLGPPAQGAASPPLPAPTPPPKCPARPPLRAPVFPRCHRPP